MAALPDEEMLQDDLSEAMVAYDTLIKGGTWVADDALIDEVQAGGRPATLTEAKNHRQHRKIERHAGTAKKVKRALGTNCMACTKSMGDVYGPVAEGYIEAHHLKPLSTYTDEETIALDVRRDFAVLCANCHRVIHRMDDTSDVAGIRALITRHSSE